MASTIRTFLAVPLPPGLVRTVGGYVRSLQRRYPQYRWQKPEQMHITVNFLGEIRDSRVADVCQMVQDVAGQHPPFDCSLGQLGAFPKPGRPRILWLGVDRGRQPLVQLHHQLAAGLLSLNMKPERKRYRPHVTLARIRDHERWPEEIVQELSADSASPLSGDSSFEVDEVVVFSSFPESTGSVHTVMSRSALRGAGNCPND